MTVNLHDRDDQTDSPVSVRLWEPVEMETLEAGLKAAGISIPERKYALKTSEPKKWRNDRLHLWRRHQHKPAVQKLYDRKLLLAQQLLTQFFDKHHDLELPVTFDTWSTPPAFLISHRWQWQAHGSTRLRRHRWLVEVYHDEGTADGLDQDQVRDFPAIYRPMALVAVTDRLLSAAQHDPVLLHTRQRHIQTTLDGSAGSGRRLTQAQALWAWATCIATARSQGQTRSEVMPPFVAAVCDGGSACPLPTAMEARDLEDPGQLSGRGRPSPG